MSPKGAKGAPKAKPKWTKIPQKSATSKKIEKGRGAPLSFRLMFDLFLIYFWPVCWRIFQALGLRCFLQPAALRENPDFCIFGLSGVLFWCIFDSFLTQFWPIFDLFVDDFSKHWAYAAFLSLRRINKNPVFFVFVLQGVLFWCIFDSCLTHFWRIFDVFVDDCSKHCAYAAFLSLRRIKKIYP